MEKILLCFKALFLGTSLYALIFSSKQMELLLSYLLISHAYKEGKETGVLLGSCDWVEIRVTKKDF